MEPAGEAGGGAKKCSLYFYKKSRKGLTSIWKLRFFEYDQASKILTYKGSRGLEKGSLNVGGIRDLLDTKGHERVFELLDADGGPPMLCAGIETKAPPSKNFPGAKATMLRAIAGSFRDHLVIAGVKKLEAAEAALDKEAIGSLDDLLAFKEDVILQELKSYGIAGGDASKIENYCSHFRSDDTRSSEVVTGWDGGRESVQDEGAQEQQAEQQQQAEDGPQAKGKEGVDAPAAAEGNAEYQEHKEATSPAETASQMLEVVDEKAKQVEHVLDFTGFALDVSVKILRIGEVLPVVGKVCKLCKDVLKDAKGVHKKIKDVQQMVRRVLDVAKFLASLPDVLKHLAEESETVKNIKAKMEEITNVITKVQDAIKKFGTKGWVGAMFTASK